MNRRTVHLLSVAGSNRELPDQLGLPDAAALADFVQQALGGGYRVTLTPELLCAPIDAAQGGRQDDALRVAELERCFADEDVVALVSLRGGAWLTRILGDVDFSCLARRRAPLFLFGFSELTGLINIAGSHPCVHAFYDLGPAYLLTSLRLHARARIGQSGAPAAAGEAPSDSARRWARTHFRDAFAGFFVDVARILSGAGSDRVLSGRLISGTLPPRCDVEIVGGCLAVLVTLCGSPLERAVDPRGRWLALEDVREDIYRLDRYLAQLKLCGLLQDCAGILLGDFTHDDEDQTDAVVNLLRRHVHNFENLPIVGRCNFGHRHGVAPLPLHQPVELYQRDVEAEVVLKPKTAGV